MSSVAALAAAKIDRSINILPYMTETSGAVDNATRRSTLYATRFRDCVQAAQFCSSVDPDPLADSVDLFAATGKVPVSRRDHSGWATGSASNPGSTAPPP